MGRTNEPAEAELPQHLFRLLEGVQRRVLAELEAVLDDDVSSVGLRRIRILQLIPAAGARQKDLADRALVTKQAMAEIVDALVDDGLVARTPDPSDGRAWLIMRTAAGDVVNEAMEDGMASVERTLERAVGADSYATFVAVMRELGGAQI